MVCITNLTKLITANSRTILNVNGAVLGKVSSVELQSEPTQMLIM